MQVLLDFLRRYNYLFLFVFCEIVSIVLLIHFNNYQGSSWLTAANTTVARVNNTYAEADAFVRLGDVNTRLTSDNIRLQQENDALRQAIRDLKRDTTFTERRIRETLDGYTLIPARVVSNSVRVGADNYIIVNRGTADGIRPEMGVVASGGVVGIVYLTEAHNSLVLPVTHSKSSISCRVRGQDYFGYLQWDGRNTRTAHVSDVPRYAKAKRGQIIETSGFSSIFPPGIFVGRVERVINSSDGQSYRLDLTLGNDFAALRDVSIIATPYKAELDSLHVRAAELEEKM